MPGLGLKFRLSGLKFTEWFGRLVESIGCFTAFVESQDLCIPVLSCQ